MIKFIKKIFAKWFGKKEEKAVAPVKKVIEPVVEKLTHCENHTRFKKSCPLCQEIVK